MIWALLACGTSDPLQPLHDAMAPAALAPHQVDGLPSRFVGLSLTPDQARVFGVGVSVPVTTHTLNATRPELDAALWPAMFSQLELPPGPMVVVIGARAEPASARLAIESAAATGMGPFTILPVPR